MRILNPGSTVKGDDGQEVNFASSDSVRSTFPSLYSFGSLSDTDDEDDQTPIQDKSKPLPGGTLPSTTVTEALGQDLKNIGTGISDALTLVIKNTKKDLVKTYPAFTNTFNALANQATSILQDSLKGNKGTGVYTALAAGLAWSPYNFEVNPQGWTNWIKGWTERNYKDNLARVIISPEMAASMKMIAAPVNGTKEGWQYPFSTTSDTNAKFWLSCDRELFTYSSALLRAILYFDKNLPNFNVQITKNSASIISFATAFAAVESNMDLDANNLSNPGGPAGYDRTTLPNTGWGNEARLGAFGAFQIRWSNVVNLFRIYGNYLADYKISEFDTSLDLQARLFILLVNESFNQVRNKYFTSVEGQTRWASDQVPAALKRQADKFGAYGYSPSLIALTFTSAMLAVGPIAPGSGKNSFAQKEEQLAAFRNNLRNKLVLATLYKTLYITGAPLSLVARIFQKTV